MNFQTFQVRNIILLLILFFVSGCQTVQTTNTPVEVSPIEYKAAWDSQPQGAEWTVYTVSALESFGKRMLAVTELKDASAWCPQYSSFNKTQRMQFYVMLISTMARYESSFKPETVYKEDFNDSKGKPVMSQGLLQISQESANQSAYACHIGKPEELKDPKTNLECGVKIADLWISKDRAIGYSVKTESFPKEKWSHYGIGRYWSVGRDKSKSQLKIKAVTAPFCGGLQ